MSPFILNGAEFFIRQTDFFRLGFFRTSATFGLPEPWFKGRWHLSSILKGALCFVCMTTIDAGESPPVHLEAVEWTKSSSAKTNIGKRMKNEKYRSLMVTPAFIEARERKFEHDFSQGRVIPLTPGKKASVLRPLALSKESARPKTTAAENDTKLASRLKTTSSAPGRVRTSRGSGNEEKKTLIGKVYFLHLVIDSDQLYISDIFCHFCSTLSNLCTLYWYLGLVVLLAQ